MNNHLYTGIPCRLISLCKNRSDQSPRQDEDSFSKSEIIRASAFSKPDPLLLQATCTSAPCIHISMLFPPEDGF